MKLKLRDVRKEEVEREKSERGKMRFIIFHNSRSVRSLSWPINYTFLLFVGTAKPTWFLIAHHKRPPLLGTSRLTARKIKTETRRAEKKRFKIIEQ